MKKILKPLLITLGALTLVVGIALAITFWYVFTPQKISPIINNQLTRFFTCEVEIGNVQLTFFNTFPRFGVQVSGFSLVNPFDNAPSDTLINVEKLTGVIDINALWRRNELILSGISMLNGNINAFIDENGSTNFDVMVSDTTTAASGSGPRVNFIDLNTIELKNINLSYIDRGFPMDAIIRNMDAQITGTISDDIFKGKIQLERSLVSFDFDGEKYLKESLVSLDLPSSFHTVSQHIVLNSARFVLDGLELFLNGEVTLDPETWDMITDLTFRFDKWNIGKVLELVPESYHHYLEGIEMDGIASSRGTVRGVLNDTLMPLVDMQLSLEKGTLKYSDFHLPLSEMSGDINIHSDFKNDEISWVRVDRFSANTPGSTFSTTGMITSLFSDIHTHLTTDANVLLDEFNPMFPDSLQLNMKGRVSGRVSSDLRMSHIDSLSIEKMKLSGDLTATALDVAFDSLWVKTDQARLQFALPNTQPASEKTRFAFTRMETGRLEAGKIEDFSALFRNAYISAEMSDVRDTTRIPDLKANFRFDHLFASMDTIRVDLASAQGNALVAPGFVNPLEPRIQLAYNGSSLRAFMGQDSTIVSKLNVDAEIVNDESQTDVFLKWLARGFIELQEGLVTMANLTHPVKIPEIKMDFEPERFDIKEGRIIIDKSDLELTGSLVNILSYFRGDSVLLGRFNFTSAYTDILQLMDLTSGIGAEKDTLNTDGVASVASPKQTNSAEQTEESFSGPYMVPLGVDFLLVSNIERASFGADTAVDIKGSVAIRNGALILEEVSFTTTAARMELTSVYRTPRKNHLFLGIDYRMLDIEIERLLQMIPDIDTLMPMLRSFRGKGEFHLVAETYLDSMYNVKKSTLRASSAIRGKNLVLLDGETFTEIANTLRFSRRAENIVDSLAAEFTVFRDEIDVYPFLIVMDRYRAVVYGRHNFDMSFIYHISVVDSPIPGRFAINVRGDMDNLRFYPVLPEFAQLYRPASRRAVEQRQLELRRIVRESLFQ